MRALLLALTVCSIASADGPAKCVERELAARFAGLEPRFGVFRDLQLGDGAKALKQTLRLALEQQKELEREYERVSSARCGRVSVDALVMIGILNEELAAKLTEAPVPKGLNTEQSELFRSELAHRAQPLSERALSVYADAVKEADGLGVNDELVQFARGRVGRDGGS